MQTIDHPPRSTRAGRLLDYLAIMFPAHVYVPYWLATFFGFYFSLQALAGIAPLQMTCRGALGAVTLVLLHLLVRVQDELKDADQDLEMAHRGDPWFSGRPLVTGHVRLDDIKALRWLTIAVILALNAPLGFPLPLLGTVPAFAVLWWSLHYFFWPASRTSRPVMLFTGAFVYAGCFAYVAAVFASDFGVARLNAGGALLGVAGFGPIAALEIARKFRDPSEETGASTYSQALGARSAALLLAVVVASSGVMVVAICRTAGLSWPYPALVLAGAVPALGACLRYACAPSALRSRLLPSSAVYAFIVVYGLPLALGATHAVELR